MRSEFANELLGSLKEALAHAKGERKDLVTHEIAISVEAEAATTDRLQDTPHSP